MDVKKQKDNTNTKQKNFYITVIVLLIIAIIIALILIIYLLKKSGYISSQNKTESFKHSVPNQNGGNDSDKIYVNFIKYSLPDCPACNSIDWNNLESAVSNYCKVNGINILMKTGNVGDVRSVPQIHLKSQNNSETLVGSDDITSENVIRSIHRIKQKIRS